MLEINIDINPLLQAVDVSEEEANSFSKMLLDRVADVYMQRWEDIVGKSLNSTRRAYQLGMDFRYVDDFNGVFVLEGKGESRLAMMIEEGASAFDIKDGMENSSKRKTKKDGGWYITVPFKQATPEALGESSTFSGKLPERVYEIAKKNAGKPVTAAQLPDEHKEKKFRPAIQSGDNLIPRYDHKTPIYEGVVKNTKPQHSGYVTFRRISDKSDEDSWIHKGFTPHKFMEKAMDDVEKELPEIIESVKLQFLEAKFR